MSASIITNITSSGGLHIGKIEGLSEEERDQLGSSSKAELSSPPIFVDLTGRPRDMRGRPHRQKGNRISPPRQAPESRRGAWSNNNDDERPPSSRPTQSTAFRPVSNTKAFSKNPSISGIDRSNSHHGRTAPTAHEAVFSKQMFREAKGILEGGDRSKSSQASTSKHPHRIKGRATTAVSKSVEGKGKAKADAPVESAHIDLTGECEEDGQVPSKQAHQKRKAPEDIINESVLAGTEASCDLSDDPLQLPSSSTKQFKRIYAMQGKGTKNNMTPSPITTSKNSKMAQSGPPRVKLRQIKFCDAQITFGDSGGSCVLSIAPDHQCLRFDITSPNKGAIINVKLLYIKVIYHCHEDPRPSQLVLELVNYPVKEMFSKHWPLSRAPPQGQLLNACHVEVLDASFNSAMEELVCNISCYEKAIQVECGELEKICKLRFPQDRCSKDDDDELSDEPESFPSRPPPAHSSHKSSPRPHSPSERSSDKTSSHAIGHLPPVSPAIYHNSNPTQTVGPRSQNHSANRISDIALQTTANPKGDRKLLNSGNRQLLARFDPAGKATLHETDARQELQDGQVTRRCNASQKKTDARPEFQDGQATRHIASQSKFDATQGSQNGQTTTRYHTRNSQSRSSIQPPIDPPELPPGPAINAPDADIVLIWPFEGDRKSRSVAITNGDLKRLADGEFLNDTLIEFGLKWELSEIAKRNPELVESMHLFNSFFFQKLSSCKPKEKTAAGEAEAYAGVRKWTKGIDIFKKDFLVIPINEHMHWYFMIVANPGRLLDPQIRAPETDSHTPCTPMRTRLAHKAETSATKQSSPTTPESQDDLTKSPFFYSADERLKSILHPAKQVTVTEGVVADNLPTDGNVAVDNSAQALQDMDLDDENSFAQDGVTNAECSTTGIKDVEMPYVFTLDSLGTPHRPQSATVLRYLINEAKDKLEQTLPESLTKSVTIKKVPVPEQPNFCDCGLYLIHAFKTFFSKPQTMLRWILEFNSKKGLKEQRQSDICATWNAAGAAQARQALRDQLRELIPEYQEVVRLRKAAADGKKQLARVRKLSCTDEPNPNEDSTKKQRLSCSEPSDQILSLPTPNPDSCAERPAPPASTRFIEGSSRFKAEKAAPYRKSILKKRTAKTPSPPPAHERSIGPVADQPQIMQDHSCGATLPADAIEQDAVLDAVFQQADRAGVDEDSRSLTPDEDLIFQSIAEGSPCTPKGSPSLDQKMDEPRIDGHNPPTGEQDLELCLDVQRPGSATPPEEDPNLDGEALPPDADHLGRQSSSSGTSARCARGGTTGRGRRKSKNTKRKANRSQDHNNQNHSSSSNYKNRNHNNNHNYKTHNENYHWGSNSDTNPNRIPIPTPKPASITPHQHSNYLPHIAHAGRNQNGEDLAHPVMVEDD